MNINEKITALATIFSDTDNDSNMSALVVVVASYLLTLAGMDRGLAEEGAHDLHSDICEAINGLELPTGIN